MSMYQYLETEQERQQEAGWETQGEAIDWDAEMAEAEAEQREHAELVLAEMMAEPLAWVDMPKPWDNLCGSAAQMSAWQLRLLSACSEYHARLAEVGGAI